MTSLAIVCPAEGTGHKSPMVCSGRHCLQALWQWVWCSTPGDWASGNPAFAVARRSCGTAPSTPSGDSRFSDRLLSPPAFALQVSRLTWEPPSELPLAAPGIQHRVPRRTDFHHPAPPWPRLAARTPLPPGVPGTCSLRSRPGACFPPEVRNHTGCLCSIGSEVGTSLPDVNARMQPSDSPAASAEAPVPLAAGLPRCERLS